MARPKILNTTRALSVKVALRQHVLDHVSPARVLDAFCGCAVMYGAVWRRAKGYVPCDSAPWAPGDPVRFVCDNRRLLRSLDLRDFNVFDFDAFGSPWEQVLILAARRKWGGGEKGAIVITDGSTIRSHFARSTPALDELVGTRPDGENQSQRGTEVLRRIALARFATRSGVRILQQWEAIGPAPARLYYAAITFEGV